MARSQTWTRNVPKKVKGSRGAAPPSKSIVDAGALEGLKRRAQMIARNSSVGERKRAEKAEIAEWFTFWLNQPELFADWLSLRQGSKDFRARFDEGGGQKPEGRRR